MFSIVLSLSVLSVKVVVDAFNQDKALVGAFSVIVHPLVEPMDRFAALLFTISVSTIDVLSGCKYQYWPRNGNCSKYILWRGDQMMFRAALMLHINILSLLRTSL